MPAPRPAAVRQTSHIAVAIVRANERKMAVRKKFQTHPELRKLLIETGEQEIVENAPGDYYWGCGADGSGRNKLGIILQEIRSELGGKT